MVTAFSIATRFLSFLFKVYLSRALGAEAVGLYQMALSVYLLTFSFAASGLPVVLSRRIAEDTALSRGKGEAYLSATVIISLFAATVIVAGFYLFRGKLSFIFADERAMPLLLIMLPALLSTSLYASLRSWFWGKRKFAAYGFAETMEEIFRIIFTAVFASGVVAAVTPINGVAVAFLLADVACVLVLLVLFIKNGGRFKRPSGYREMIKSGAPITAMKAFGGIITALTAIVIPSMLVKSGYSTHDATATFGRVAGMAMPLLMAPTTLTGSLSVVLIPEIAAAGAKNDSVNMRAKIEGSIVFSLFIASFFCILFMPLGKEITEILFNDSESGIYLANSAVLLFPIGINQITLSMLNSLGMEKKSFLHYVTGTTFLILSIFLLPRYIGIYAVAVGGGICFTITSVMNLRMLNKKVSLFEKTRKPLLTLLMMPPCLVLTYLLKFLLLPVLPKFIAVVLSGGIPMALYIGLAAAFKIIDVTRFFSRKKKTKNKN